MKTTSRVFIGAVATGLLLAAQAASAGMNAAAHMAYLSLAVGQTGASGGDPRREVLDRLSRARQAMDEGNWEIADSLVTQAENMKVEFGKFYLGDTPKKARRDLQRRRPSKGSGANAPAQKDSMRSPSRSSDDRRAAPQDPFQRAGRNEIPAATRGVPPPPDVNVPDGRMSAAAPRATAESVAKSFERERLDTGGTGRAAQDRYSADRYAADRHAADRGPAGRNAAALGAADRGDPSSIFDVDDSTRKTPFGHDPILTPEATDNVTLRTKAAESSAAGGGDAKARGDSLLIAARRALAVGDVQRAGHAVEQAKALPVERGLHDDSPAKVEAAIRNYADLTQRSANKDSDAYRRRYVELLMDQSEGLLAWKQLDDAERLANDARKVPVTYSPFDAKPDDLLKRIADVRRQGAGGGQTPPGAEPRNHLRDDIAAGLSAPRDVGGSLEIPFRQEGLPATAATSAAKSAQAGPDRQHVLELVHQARAALSAGDVRRAEQLAREAQGLRVPDSAFQREDDRPELVLLDVQKQLHRGVVPAGGVMPGDGPAAGRPGPITGSRAVYHPATDRTRNVAAAGQEPLPTPPSRDDSLPNVFPSTDAPPGGTPPAGIPPAAGEPSMIDKSAAGQQILARKVAAELGRQESEARRLLESEPKRALEMLRQARTGVEKAGLDEKTRDQFLRSVDRRIVDVERYILTNRPRIELNERNDAVRKEIDREQAAKVEVQEKLALMVNEFNKLMDEQRFAEAEVVAKRAEEYAPYEPVVQQLLMQSKFVRRFYNNLDLNDSKEQAVIDTLYSVEKSSTPFDDTKPFIFGDVKDWEKLTKSKFRMQREGRLRRSPKEIEIEQRLKTPVSLKFPNAPLSEVIDYLGKIAQVNVRLDPRGLAEEGVTTDTPVTIDLSQEITLRSALNLILEPLNLSYVIKDEVLKITSEQLRDGEVYTVPYNVADLVIPIPMFIPNGRMGMAGALQDALSNLRPGGVGSFGGDAPLSVLASNSGAPANAMIDPRMLAQMGGAAAAPGMVGVPVGSGGPPGMGVPQAIGYGPGGLGGGAQPDFASLINLITSTIQPTTWDENGGPGAIQPHFNNLSLVISQTQQVHEEIEDLLQQLRRLQDLQVTIEVRFITLNDNFFERIGIDFDFDISDNLPPGKAAPPGGSRINTLAVGQPGEDLKHRLRQDITVGLATPEFFTSDLDIPFRQDSFLLATPQFGNFNPAAGASLGFAILSDLEAYFFINAAQGDTRSNVLQAPKVTLFNGQSASVTDTSQSPFVISVIPVVGDFAAAQQPVIVVLSEGTFLTVQAVVSSDKRFVRLTVVPFFSNIGDVNTFTFTGSSTSTDDESSEGKVDDTTGRTSRTTTTTEGTTVQLPTFAFVSVSTTVSVPDGGTVLLGGIKRLSEGRNEFGVPILNKIPYLNRLFSNVGIGRETQSLMMMVTPRIIIQEEEEFNLTGQLPPP